MRDVWRNVDGRILSRGELGRTDDKQKDTGTIIQISQEKGEKRNQDRDHATYIHTTAEVRRTVLDMARGGHRTL